jgi:hypothetical protein
MLWAGCPQCGGKLGMHRDQPTAALLCRMITQLYDIADLAAGVTRDWPAYIGRWLRP